jgi:hypothetical protein
MLKYLTIRPIWKKLFWFIVGIMSKILTPIYNYGIAQCSKLLTIFFYFHELYFLIGFFFVTFFLLIKLLWTEILWPTHLFNFQFKHFNTNYTTFTFHNILVKLFDLALEPIAFEFIFHYTYHLNCEVDLVWGYDVSWW